MSNWTAVFHQERIPDTQIISSFSGMFIPILIPSNSDSYEITDIEQICVQYSNKIKIYGIKSEKINEEIINKLYLLNIYEIFDKIEYSLVTCSVFLFWSKFTFFNTFINIFKQLF